MEINAQQFLTDEQKSELGTALFNKMLDAINSLEFAKGKKISVAQLVQAEIEEIFNNADVYDQVDFNKVAKKITDKICEGI